MPKRDYLPISLCDTSKMSREEWLKMRTGELHGIPCTIGGSEASSVFDLNPWVCSKELYDKKIGIKPAIVKEFNEENKEMGNIFERYVQEMFILWFKKNYGTQLIVCKTIEEFNTLPNAIYNDKHFYQHGAKDEDGNLLYPFAVANVDGLIKINHRIGIMEYKTTTTHGNVGKKNLNLWKQGKPPVYYEYQTRHYMGVLNVEYAFLVCAWAFSLSDMAACYIERDFELEEEIFSGEKEFVTAVLEKREWQTNECKAKLLSQYYTLKYGETEVQRAPVQLDSAYYPLLERMMERTNRKKELEKAIDDMEDKDAQLICLLSPIIENASNCYCRKGENVISVKITTPKTRSMTHDIRNNALCISANLDYERLQRDYPDIWKKYQEQVFDVKTFKTQNTALFKKYKLPEKPTGNPNIFEARLMTY